ncbi:lipopolysaccharide biosynthesis protein [Lyngbya confervoides]|uniref:Lipopolysaccharide biosynthesis protein n=1 Tax=Lyngbya confervoides BDU141951 TaxID=1574623 RepID=A0ABD4T7H6_9CYAN|nr:lipopolysaccharide biosynthesis protein [Lyngbya confervoides]MCM1984678.1 lipopolysaccharide biosynthesis protein [Lyngbya confervoides BDU141951]
MALQRIQNKLASQYLQNVGWLGIAELFNRIFRLGTTVTLARVFTETDYGLTAIIYTTFEIASVFTLRQGISGKIIQTDPEQLEEVCKTAYWLNWIACIGIFLLQGLAAFPIAAALGDSHLIGPLWGVATIYLMFPTFMVQSALILRENRMQVKALCNALQSLISNGVTIVMALLGFGIWSIVAGMVLSTPVWMIVHLKSHPWRPPQTLTFTNWRGVVSFGGNLLLVELLHKIRSSLDYLIVGPVLGLEQLGLYFFAFNAGSGITTNVVYTLIGPLFPKFCEARSDLQRLRQRYWDSLKLISLVIGAMVLLQSTLAPFYVPIVFGAKWTPAIPILILICGSVLPRAYGWAAAALLNAQDKTHLTLGTDLGFTLLFALALAIAVQFGLLGVAIAVLATHLCSLIPLTLWVDRYSFQRPAP